MGARLKAANEHSAATAWWSRNLHYVEKLKPLDHYLKPPRKASPDEGAYRLRGMIAGMKAKQEAQNGDR